MEGEGIWEEVPNLVPDPTPPWHGSAALSRKRGFFSSMGISVPWRNWLLEIWRKFKSPYLMQEVVTEFRNDFYPLFRAKRCSVTTESIEALNIEAL